MLDEVKVYQDVQAIEEIPRTAGKAPRVRFLSGEEQQAWERQYPKPPIGAVTKRNIGRESRDESPPLPGTHGVEPRI